MSAEILNFTVEGHKQPKIQLKMTEKCHILVDSLQSVDSLWSKDVIKAHCILYKC